MPKLSVIVAADRWAVPGKLTRCLESITSQSFSDIEVICTLSGAAGDVSRAARDAASADERIRVLEGAPTGGGALQAGFDAATGEYALFADSTDRLLPYTLETLSCKMDKHELDVLRCAAIPRNTEWDRWVNLPAADLSSLGPGDFNRIVAVEPASPLFSSSASLVQGMYRRSFLKRSGASFADLDAGGERLFLAQSLLGGPRAMVSRDRVAVCEVGYPDDVLAVRAETYSSRLAATDAVASAVAAADVDDTVAEAVCDAEFERLLSTYAGVRTALESRGGAADGGGAAGAGEAASDGETAVEVLCREMDAYVDSYGGPWRKLLVSRYVATLKRVARLAKAGACGPAEASPFHDECDHPRVSVVVPTYNVDDYLDVALHSLTSQTLDDIEFVCINDGSTDGSLAIMRAWAAVDRRFRILDGPNGGYGKGMNRGLDAARGEYLGILEPDDFVPPDMYGSLYDAAVRVGAEIVKADFYRFSVNADGTLSTRRENLAKGSWYYNRVICPTDELEAFSFVMNTWSGIYQMSFLRKWGIRHNETPGASFQDNGFWFQTFCRAERLYIMDGPSYMNRRDNPNSSVFSAGKVMCMTEEYAYIKEQLMADPALEQRVEDVFYRKKLANHLVTYNRLGSDRQADYARHIRDEFADLLAEGKVTDKTVGKGNWRILNEIMEDPDKFASDIRVSVVMPVYNAEKVLRKTLEGLLVRNEIGFEVICVDDGSTDGSLDILREIEAADERVRVVTQANAGAGAARNTGMDLAVGEYLAFLDADDMYDPTMLRLAYNRARVHDADVVVFRSDQYFEDTGTYAPAAYTIHNRLLPPGQGFSGDEIRQDVFKVFVGWPWDKLFRASFVRENNLRFQEIRTSNDLLFVFSAIVRAQSITTMSDVLAHHRRASGTLSVTREKSWDACHEALLALRGQLREWGLFERREQDFVNYCVHFLLWHLNSLSGEALTGMHAALKDEWADEFGITGRSREYFYNEDEYRAFQMAIELDTADYLAWRAAEVKREGDARVAARDDKIAELDATLAAREREMRTLVAIPARLPRWVVWLGHRAVRFLRRAKRFAKRVIGGR